MVYRNEQHKTTRQSAEHFKINNLKPHYKGAKITPQYQRKTFPSSSVLHSFMSEFNSGSIGLISLDSTFHNGRAAMVGRESLNCCSNSEL